VKVIQINASDYGGGVETVVRLHHRELRRTGHRAQLLVGRKKGEALDINLIPFRRGPKGLLRTARRVQQVTGLQNIYSPSFRAVEESFDFKPDVVHIHSLHGADSYAELSVVAKLSRKYPTVITLHDFWLMTGHCGYPLGCSRWLTGCGRCPDLTRYPSVARDATRWNFRAKRKLFRKAKLSLIVPSEYLRQQASRSPILGHLPIYVVPNPVDCTVFTPSTDAELRSRRRAEFGIDEDEMAVMLIANNLNNPYKGMADGIAAINEIRQSRIKVVLVGNAADQASGQLNAEPIKLGYTRSATELAEYYRMVDLLVMPSRCETFGLVAAEAMACGTPVVAFDAGALREVIGESDSGIVVPRRDPAAMANEVEQLASNRERRRRMSEAAVTRVRKRFGVAEHTSGVVAVYQDVVPPNDSVE
jgi:glycosyltransferase involved in cell wall biosynthesis